jgi:cAMP-dependent protein kinase regulator
MGISEETFGLFNKKQSVTLAEIPKSAESHLLIKSLIRNSILFQNLDWKDEEQLIKTMSEKTFQAGQTVIKEGEDGEELFIVDSGEYECSKIISGEETYLKTYKHGDAFGELALMYNAPRAASIVCKEPGKLYTLDRAVFSQVVKEAAFKKRELYRKVIDSIDLFSSIDLHNK